MRVRWGAMARPISAGRDSVRGNRISPVPQAAGSATSRASVRNADISIPFFAQYFTATPGTPTAKPDSGPAWPAAEFPAMARA